MQHLTIVRMRVDALKQDPQNARKHPKKNLAAIRASLERFGQRAPILVKQDGTVVAGNGTLLQLREMGAEHADVVVFDGTDEEARALAIAMNRTAELAEWNDAELMAVLNSLSSDLQMASGFVGADLMRATKDLGFGECDDVVPGLAADAVSRTGDVWLLGRHRLMCGDSSSAEDVDRLLAGAPIHLVNTDPPYNVKVEPRSNNAIAAGLSSFTSTHHQGLDLARHPEKAKPTHERLRAKDRPLANDFVSDEEFAVMLRKWFGNAARVLLPGRGFYIWGGYANLGNYPSALKECELYFSQAIVWDKQHPVLTRKDFMGAFELAFYGWKEGAAHQFYGPANVADLWHVKKLNHTAMVHLTEKPSELAVMAMAYSSREGENVLDLFGGSGSTMAAAEQTGRKAFLMELDQLYCDVIVQRLQRLTKEPARLESSGQSFEAVAKERGVALEGVVPGV